MSLIYLVACVKAKQDGLHKAEDLYTSPWFRKAKSYAQQQTSHWFILSAKYGLLAPERLVEPYEQSLNRMNSPARKQWAAQVWEELKPLLQPSDHIYILAGKHYRSHLVPLIQQAKFDVHIPLEGLGIGQQLKRLNELNSAHI